MRYSKIQRGMAAILLLLSTGGCATSPSFLNSSQRISSDSLRKSAIAAVKHERTAPNDGRLVLSLPSGRVLQSIDAPTLVAAAIIMNRSGERCLGASGGLFIHPNNEPAPAEWHSCDELVFLGGREELYDNMAHAVARTVEFSLYLNALYDAQHKAVIADQRLIKGASDQNKGIASDMQKVRENTEQFHKEMMAKLSELKAQIEQIK